MSKYNSAIHHRRSIRMKGYDYSQAGLYFITICCQHRECLFGKIENGVMYLNDAGKMIYMEWLKLPERFTNIQLHEFVVMPNHFHGIVEIVGAPLVGALFHPTQPQTGQPQGIAPTGAHQTGKTIGDMMDAFKSITTVEYIRGVKNMGWQSFNKKLWQRNYWEHIIRDDASYERISNYIINNPAKWEEDMLNR